MWLQGGIAGVMLGFVGAWMLDLRARAALAERVSRGQGDTGERDQWQSALRELPTLRIRISELERELSERKTILTPVAVAEAPRVTGVSAMTESAATSAPATSGLAEIPDLTDDQRDKLVAAGFCTLAAIAKASGEDLLAAIDAQPWDMVDPEAWIKYAQSHAESTAAAPLAAPVAAASPDDFTVIDGITDDFQAALYDRGITTFAQLAATDPAALPELVGAQPWDFVEPEAWIAAAEARA